MDAFTLHLEVQRAIEEYQPPSGVKTLGVPWSAEKVKKELDALKKALVTPYIANIGVPDDEARLLTTSGPFWVVAELGADVVYYDEGADAFGLAQVGNDGAIESINVRGDLPGVFMAR